METVKSPTQEKKSLENKLKDNQFKWNNQNYTIENLSAEDKKKLQEDGLLDVVFGRVEDTKQTFVSWCYSIKSNPPYIIVSIGKFFIKLFIQSKDEKYGYARLELTYSQFNREIQAIREYEKNKPINDKEAIQEMNECHSFGRQTAKQIYIETSLQIASKKPMKSFKSYFEEAERLIKSKL